MIASGRILPKLSGNVGVGIDIRQVDTPDQNTQADPGFSASLKWDINELTSLSIQGRRELETSILGINNSRTYGSIFISRTLTKRLTANAGFTIDLTNYDETILARDDDNYSYSVNVRYILTKNISLNTSYLYQDQQSNFLFNDYTRFTFNIGASGSW